METFCDSLFNQFNEAHKTFYVGRIVYSHLKIISSMNDLIDTEILKLYLDFLDVIPKEKYNEVAVRIWLYIFDCSVQKEFIKNKNNTIENLKPKVNSKPKDIIKSDLNTVKKFKNTIERVFQSGNAGTHIRGQRWSYRTHRMDYGALNNLTDKKSYSIDDLFEIVDLMIEDLETEDFKFIGKNSYYKYEEPTKEDFKNYLRSICKEYNINAYEYRIREFMENLKFK